MSILSPALLGAVGLVLLASAAGHLRSPAALRHGLDAQGVVPQVARRAVSLLLGPVETVLGVAAILAAVTGPRPALALWAGLPSAALFAVLALYLTAVLRSTAGRPVPCACGLGEAPVGPSTVLRAAFLGAMAALGGATAGGWSPGTAPHEELIVALAAALVLAVATALLPAARAVPAATLHVRTVDLGGPR
ncbi:MauE/DoxX family redox-associated membrane protein [Ornithinimicrobium avium]|uniref:Methylamine utilisation protein MauE domain-containing protein n=1 Tax=Ornithinimicrobium avium TaxID=2283195 RepID=A0A345NQ74_9MICO|nr:MauE/DoxX family redox-associated membrane protein [Ornithinimicrobium avium]AXH97182.1 hypothetical protein DV701_14605 [Ornithinimicrobium avium]